MVVVVVVVASEVALVVALLLVEASFDGLSDAVRRRYARVWSGSGAVWAAPLTTPIEMRFCKQSTTTETVLG